MLKSISGIFRNGKIEPTEKIPFKTEKKVIITFLPENETNLVREKQIDLIPLDLRVLWKNISKRNYISEKLFLELIQNDHVWKKSSIEKIKQARNYINQWKIESF